MTIRTSTRCLVLTIMVVAEILISCNHLQVAAQCEGSIPTLVSECEKYVQKPGPDVPPSAECCGVVKGVDIPCICKSFTKEIEALVSMEKVVYVARTCGLTIQPGMKCGSYTVPPTA